MGGTGARGRTHPQPLIAFGVTLGPTTPKPDKSLVINEIFQVVWRLMELFYLSLQFNMLYEKKLAIFLSEKR
jgi:hypothetical protein